ncbi:MAG: response regulator, partial [Rhodoferax sp.]|nr:response regulator [Rhodoferax sp.]
MSIFVIDDDETSLVLVTVALEQLGINEIQVAKDGQRALQMFDRMAEKPEAIICDIYMPNMDGIEILSALEARQYRGGIVLVSGADPQMLELAQLIARSGQMQFLGAVAKPVSSEALGPLLGRP